MKNNFLFQKLGLSTAVIAFCLPFAWSAVASAQTPTPAATPTPTPAPAPSAPAPVGVAPGNTSELAAPMPSAPVPPDALSPTAGKVERVEVIGSRIKRIAVEGVSPVQSVSGEDMATQGNLTVADALRESTSASYGAIRETSGRAASATATIGLRGLGAMRTLVLLNGRRLPKDPSMEAVDLNLVPPSAIERVDTLKDGASALYGSDALGGVVNIVTKKGFNGNELQVMFTAPERKGGSKLTTALVTGSSNEKSDFLLVMNMTRTEKVVGKDRPLSAVSLSLASSVGSFLNTGNQWNISPNDTCPPDMIRDVGNGTMCYYNAADHASNSPTVGQVNLLSDYTYRTANSLQFYNRNLVVFKDINWNYAPAATSTLSTPTGTASQPNARTIAYRFAEAGNRDNQDDERNMSTVFGLKGYLKGTWEWDFSVGYGRVNRTAIGISGYLDQRILSEMIADRTYDPFAAPGAKGDISAAAAQTFTTATSTILSSDLLFTGEVGELSGGPIGMAVGMSAWNESISSRADSKTMNGEILSTAGSSLDGQRSITAAFAEVAFPVTEKLEISAAGRVDHYSDFGATFNPKLGAKYNVNPKLLVRSSVGTGYRAPSLDELYGAQSAGYLIFRDAVSCAADPAKCNPGQFLIYSGGNKDLKEEKAITASAGIVWEPNEDFSTSADAWVTKLDNVIGVDLEEAIKAEARGENIAQYGITIERDPVSNEILRVISPNLNLASNEIAGLDWQVNAGLINNLRGHRLSLVNNLSYMLYDKFSGFPGQPLEDNLGQMGAPRFRNNLSLNLQNNFVAYTLTMRTIPGQAKDSNPSEKLKDSHEFDFAAVYKMSKATTLTAGIKNVFDSEAPYDSAGGVGGAPLVSASLYDINGRRFFLGFNQTF